MLNGITGMLRNIMRHTHISARLPCDGAPREMWNVIKADRRCLTDTESAIQHAVSERRMGRLVMNRAATGPH
jgi:hypothetical protein